MVKYYLDTHPDKRGEQPIRVSVRVAGKPYQTTIGYSISPDKWTGTSVDPGTKKNPTISARGIPAATINARIAKITAAFSLIEATPGAATKEAYQTALAKITGKAAKAATGPDLPEVLAAFDTFIREESRVNRWTDGTLKCWHAFRGHLELFNDKLTFADLDTKGLDNFVEYLQTRALGAGKAARAKEDKATAEEHLNRATTEAAKARAAAAIKKADKILKEIADHPERNGLEDKTAKKHYTNLKWFLMWCIRKGITEQKAIVTHKAKFFLVKKPVVFLTRQELMKLYYYTVPANGTEVTVFDMYGNERKKTVHNAGALEKTRDFFCFQAFTSLRYSDMAALKRTDIVEDTIKKTAKKTRGNLEIPLNDYSRAILAKYAGYRDPEGHALPIISSQKMDDYLKDLGELCGFNSPVTKPSFRGNQLYEVAVPKYQCLGTHAARRTFICNALTIGIPPQVVMKWTGHSDYKAMKPYIDIAATDAAAAMEKMNKTFAL